MIRQYLKKYIFIIIITSLLPCSSLFSEEKSRIAILDFTPENTQLTYAKAVRNIFEISLFKTDKFRILERDKMESILQEQGFQMSGCTDTSCAVQIGRILSADMVVIGSLNKITDYTITVKFIKIVNGSLELADSETAENDDAIQSSVASLAKRMAENITRKEKTTFSFTEKKKSKKPLINVSVYGLYLFPFATFSDLAKSGYGLGSLFYIEGILIPNLLLGIEAGYIRLSEEPQNVDYCSMIPFLACTGYIYNISDFSIIPSIRTGISYNTVSYVKDGVSAGEKPDYSPESKAEIISKAGIDLLYHFTNNLSLKAGAEYGAIFEKDENLYFCAFIAGINFQF